MTVVSWLCLACSQAAAQQAAQGTAPVDERWAEDKPAAPAPGIRLTDETVSRAVKATLAENPRSIKRESGRVLSGDRYEKFARGFSEAEKPGCLRPDALKFQPHSLTFKILGQDYVMAAGGKLAIPFWIAAVVRGKCN